MTDWFTADWHLGHTNILKFCNRPYKSVDKMTGALLRNTNEVVKPNDRLYILGDFWWYGPEKSSQLRAILHKIKCKKILILGNHDRLHAMKYVEYGFESVHTSLVYVNKMHGEILLGHDPSISTVWPRDKYMLCGHVHDLFVRTGNVINVGVDVWNYRPVTLEQAIRETAYEKCK